MYFFKNSSGIPLFWTSEMQTSHFNRHFAQIQIAFSLTAIHYNPRDANTLLYSVKQTSSSVHLVPRLYIIHWIMQMLTCLSHKFVCHRWSIQQLDVIIALVQIVLSHKCTARESSRTCLCSTQHHGNVLPRLLEIYRKRLKYGRLYNPDMQR